MEPKTVKLRAYGDEVITRVLVEEDGDTVLVCRPEEYSSARQQHRPPVLVGFARSDLVEV